MNTMFSRMIGAGVLFLLVFLSGFWLTRSGKPYSTAIFTLHKLIALAAVILLVVLTVQAARFVPLHTGQWLTVIVSAVCLVGLFVSGALLSLEKAMPGFVVKTHHALPYLAVIAVGVSLYLLIVRDGLPVVQ